MQEFDMILPHEDSEELFDIRSAIETSQIDFVIADITYPSTGQGVELTWINAAGIPIECLYLEGSQVSHTLKLLTNKFFDYETEEDMIDMMKVILLGYTRIHDEAQN